MKIHKEGFGTIAIASALLGIIVVALFTQQWLPLYINYVLYVIALFSLGLVIRFFRIPNRTFNLNENAILTAADGKVVAIENIEDEHFPGEKRKQISVFMSPLNVHVNYYSISGEVIEVQHKKGKHYPAFLPKSSTDNEQSFIVIKQNDKRNVLLKQIAGSLARRIVFHSQKGKQIKQGEEMGIIKLGSRVDHILPEDVKVNVTIGQKVKAGIDTLAYFK